MNMPIDHTRFDHAVSAAEGPLTNRADHVFDLHPALHVATFASFFAYLGIMWLAFATDELIIPFVIFAVFLAAAFAVPAWWARVAPPPGAVKTWDDFLRDGIETHTGPLGASGAMIQVLIMPAMLICWGLAVAIIRALV